MCSLCISAAAHYSPACPAVDCCCHLAGTAARLDCVSNRTPTTACTPDGAQRCLLANVGVGLPLQQPLHVRRQVARHLCSTAHSSSSSSSRGSRCEESAATESSISCGLNCYAPASASHYPRCAAAVLSIRNGICNCSPRHHNCCSCCGAQTSVLLALLLLGPLEHHAFALRVLQLCCCKNCWRL
jgi:hypothetical protein